MFDVVQSTRLVALSQNETALIDEELVLVIVTDLDVEMFPLLVSCTCFGNFLWTTVSSV